MRYIHTFLSLYFTYVGDSPNEPIFDTFSNLAKVVINQEYNTSCLSVKGFWLGGPPENLMFPYESEVVLNIVLHCSARL